MYKNFFPPCLWYDYVDRQAIQHVLVFVWNIFKLNLRHKNKIQFLLFWSMIEKLHVVNGTPFLRFKKSQIVLYHSFVRRVCLSRKVTFKIQISTWTLTSSLCPGPQSVACALVGSKIVWSITRLALFHFLKIFLIH